MPNSSDPVKVLQPTSTLKSDFTPQMLTRVEPVKSKLEDQNSSDSDWGKYYSYVGSSEHDTSDSNKNRPLTEK